MTQHDNNHLLNEEIDYNEYGAIEYSWDFDEDEYADFLEEEGLERNEETLKEYIDYFVTVEIEFFDCETFHQVNYESMSVADLEDYFGEKVAKIIIEDLKEKGEGKYEMAYLYDDDEIDINNPNELNARAKAVLRNGAYFKGCRGFILTDGTIVYTPTEHNEIGKINGIEDKFQFIHLGNIRIISDGLDVWTPPTPSQWSVISQVLRAYRGEGFYLSLYSDREYCVSYHNLHVDKAIEDIERFFNEGKVPQMVQEGRKIHITKGQLNMIKENIEQEVEPSDVDLSSFDVEKSLYPKLWNENNELDSRARLQLLDIADDFIETLNVRWVKPIDIRLYGSICSYNWSEFSDIDMHVVMDFSEVDERVDLVEDYFNVKKNAWNETHKELKIYGLPVELYVEDVTAETNSEGIYSLNKNGWLKEPDPNDIEPIEDTEAIKNGTADLMTLIDDLIEEYETTSDKHIIGEIGEDVDKILKFLKELRKTSLEQGGEMSNGNISYKTLRRFGYLDKLYDLSAKCYDAVNSLEENKKRI